MFSKSDIIAFILRIIVFLLVFCAFPILLHFFRATVLKIMYGEGKKEAEDQEEMDMNEEQ